ncbi:TolB family protein [Asanoa siamensis]|nr:PD40 domain-containing protein [Asanoa siamensis]
MLQEIADEMPPARLPDDLWRAGRRLRQRRRFGYAVAAVVVLVLALAVPTVAGHRRAAVEPADRPGAVPSRVEQPHLWQAAVGQWPAGAGGPAALVFFTARTRYFESTGVTVGRNGSYRLIYQDIGEENGLLTPDGRYYVRPGLRMLDLTTGAQRRLADVADRSRPLAFSPDGSELLVGIVNDDEGIVYGDDAIPDSDPEKPDDLIAVDMRTGAQRYVAVGRMNSYTTAAWSPDGTRIAVEGPVGRGDVGRRLSVMDARTGEPISTTDNFAPDRRLAGRAAWTPDGGLIALLAFEGCTERCDLAAENARRWRLELADPTSGSIVTLPVPIDGAPGEVVGWRDGRDAVLTYAPDRDDPRRWTLAALRPNGEIDTLVDTPPGVSDLEVPDGLLRSGAFGGPPAEPSIWAAPAWAYAIALAPVLLVLAIVRRRRQRARV